MQVFPFVIYARSVSLDFIYLLIDLFIIFASESIEKFNRM